MKLTQSLLFALVSVGLVFVCFILFFLETLFGNPCLFLAIKTAIFAALCFVLPVIGQKKVQEKQTYGKLLLRSHNIVKTDVLNVALSALAAVLLYFFAAFCYSGVICFYEAVTEKIAIFGSSVASSAGAVILSLSLKGILLPLFVSAFYFGKGGKLFGKKQYGMPIVVLFATFIDFSLDGVLILFAINILLAAIEKKTQSATSSIIAYVAYSLCGAIVSLIGTLPYSYMLVSSVETAWYYSTISFGIGLIFLAASIFVLDFVKVKTQAEEKREVIKLSGEEKCVFCGTCVLYLILTVATHVIVYK